MKIKDSPRGEAALSSRINVIATGKPKEKMDLSLSLKAFMRTKTLETSAWYMASLTKYLVEKKDAKGGFSLMESLLVDEASACNSWVARITIVLVIAGIGKAFGMGSNAESLLES